MILVKQEATNKENSSCIYLIDKKSKSKDFEPQFSHSITGMIAGTKKFDYLRLSNSFVFFVFDDQKPEELRVIGSRIHDMICADCEVISISGKSKNSCFLAEGIALTNYQFLKYLVIFWQLPYWFGLRGGGKALLFSG